MLDFTSLPLAPGLQQGVQALGYTRPTPIQARSLPAILDGLRVASETEVSVDAAADRWIVVRLQAPYGVASPGSHPVQLEVHSPTDGTITVQAKTTFLVPR